MDKFLKRMDMEKVRSIHLAGLTIVDDARVAVEAGASIRESHQRMDRYDHRRDRNSMYSQLDVC